jgi:primosomal protein N' (replication factor Y)
VDGILRLAVDVPLRRLFDYRPPPGVAASSLPPGVRLWVPFGRRRVVGILVETRETSDVPAAKLRAAIAVIDEEPILDPPLLELLRWSADYYHHPPGEVMAAALPAPLRAGTSAQGVEERWALTAAARAGELPPLSPRAERLRELVEILGAHAATDAAALAARSPRWRE